MKITRAYFVDRSPHIEIDRAPGLIIVGVIHKSAGQLPQDPLELSEQIDRIIAEIADRSGLREDEVRAAVVEYLQNKIADKA